MAAESLSLLTGGGGKPVLHILHMGGSPMVRSIGMRPASAKCVACGPDASITDDLEAVEYDALCGVIAEGAGAEALDRLSVKVRPLAEPN